jgi:hypothetical protein
LLSGLRLTIFNGAARFRAKLTTLVVPHGSPIHGPADLTSRIYYPLTGHTNGTPIAKLFLPAEDNSLLIGYSTFTFLTVGFILLDLAHFGLPHLTVPAAVVLIICALNAWYMMAHVIFMQVFGIDILPVGKPWIEPKTKEPVGAFAEALPS